MQNKRRLTPLIAAAVLVPALSSCMNYATDMIYTPAAGVNDRDGDVDILNAAIVSTDGTTGRFIASLNNDDIAAPNSLEDLSGTGASGTLNVNDFDPIEVPANGLVNLADEEVAGGVGIPVAGDFGVGDFLEMTITFGDGSSSTLQVPVLPNADEYAGIDGEKLSDLEREVPEDTFLLEEGHGEGHSEGGE